MIAVDYFLYDNRTQSQWGRDWGIKAATGMLETRGDLKADFSRYCGAMPSQRGSLSGFGAAIGGFRSRMAGGYLLCVTLESRDLAGRPSWAVFGLWCPDAKTLEAVVTADPIACARAVLGAETPPGMMHIHPASTALRAIRKKTSKRTAFHRFDPDASVREVLSLLLGSIRAGIASPNILGITASSRLPELADAGFDRVYSHPMDDTTTRALARVLTGPEPEIEEEPPPRVQTIPEKSSPASGTIVPPGSPIMSDWPLWLTAGIALAVSVVLFAPHLPREIGHADPVERPAPSETAPPPPPPVQTQTSADYALLDDIQERLEELKQLQPDALLRSKGYVTAKEPVLKTWEPEQKKVREAYATLLDVRERMTDKGQVAYYYDDAGKGIAPEKKLEKILAFLEPHPLGGRECETLRYAFAFEFENESSTLSRWCASLTRLESTVRSAR